MAKKTAPKKKPVASKAKSVKTSKPAKANKPAAKTVATKVASKAKPVALKASKPAAKTSKVVAKSVVKEVAKPSLMTKKGKAAKAEVDVEVVEVKKTTTIVSILEAQPESNEPTKAEKISKVKPVKVDRGNLADEKAKWAELFKKYGKEKALNYKMTETFPSLVPLQHKVLGWGFVLTNENDRLEVLFENGIRMLISNYKS